MQQTKALQVFSPTISLVLTDFIHGGVEMFQFGAVDEEVCTNVVYTVPAHVQKFDLWQTQRHAELRHAVATKNNQKKRAIVM